MILAEGATQVTSETADRQDPTAGVKAVERLFFDRVQGDRGDFSVVDALYYSADIPARPA